MKAKDLEVGDLVPIYYKAGLWGHDEIDKAGVITDIVGYKSTVLVDGALESWDLSDLKKMAANKAGSEDEDR